MMKTKTNIVPGLYAETEDFIRDFGDITWTADKKEIERLHKKFEDALWYLEYMSNTDPVTNQNVSITQTMILAEIGRVLVKAAWLSGFRSAEFKYPGDE